MRRRLFPLLAALFLLLAAAGRAEAQVPRASLEQFVDRVARLWAGGDASGLVELAPRDGRILLELGGEGAEPVPGRHAAAALRDLFKARQTVSARAVRVNVAGGQPVAGFGELAWVSRSAGVTEERRTTVYVGVVWEGEGWRVRELRVRQ